MRLTIPPGSFTNEKSICVSASNRSSRFGNRVGVTGILHSQPHIAFAETSGRDPLLVLPVTVGGKDDDKATREVNRRVRT